MKTSKQNKYSWFRRPRREDFRRSLREIAFGTAHTIVDPRNPSRGVASAIDQNTNKLAGILEEYRYQSACSDWKANIAITIAIASIVVSGLVSVLSSVIAHADSKDSTVTIVEAIKNLKGVEK